MILLDTNVISEALKPAPDPAVAAWIQSQPWPLVATTSVTVAELFHGLELLPHGHRRHGLQIAVRKAISEFDGRILPFEEPAALIYAEISAHRRSLGRPIQPFDALIAAIARHHGAVLATRDTQDFDHCGIRLVNPWSAPAKRR